jgi:hypothetical protein
MDRYGELRLRAEEQKTSAGRIMPAVGQPEQNTTAVQAVSALGQTEQQTSDVHTVPAAGQTTRDERCANGVSSRPNNKRRVMCTRCRQ